MSKINQKLILEKILLKDLFLEHINFLNEADPPATTTATGDKKPEQPEPQVAPIADEIAPLVQQIKTADSNMKKAENEFINAAKNVLDKTKATDNKDSEVRSAELANIRNKLMTILIQNKNLGYRNLANRDSSMLTIIDLLDARYEELTGGEKLPTLNPNKILPGLMAAKAAGQAVPSAPSIGPSAAVGSVGSSAARSTSGPTASVQEHKNLLKNAIKLLIKEITEEQAPENFNFEYLKKELKSRDWEKKWKAIDYAKDKLQILGEGSSRVALLLPMPDGKKVLKIAINKAGIAQNKQELQIYLNPSIAKLYTDLYEWDKTGMWLLTEYIQPFRTEEAFARAIGVPNYNIYYETIADNRKWLARDLQELKEIHEVDLEVKKEEFLKKSKNKALTERDKLVLEGEFNSFKRKTEKKIENINLILENEKAKNFITKVINLMQRGLVYQDLNNRQFGLSANGEIKLYDYGYSVDVWKKFYRR